MDVENKVVIVTGASRGIGAGIARNFARAGARVVLAARSAGRLEQVVSEIVAEGGEALAHTADVASPPAIDGLLEATLARYQRVDVLVNNAGVASSIFPALDLSLEEWDRVQDVNLRGLFVCCRTVGRSMIAQGSGRIVNIASIIGSLGFPDRSAYGSSKAGVIYLTQGLACEWSEHGVTVNSVSPGYVRTELVDEDVARGDYELADILKRIPTRRLVEVDDIANAVRFLASDAAGSITGVDLPVDGGWKAYGSF